MTPINSTMVLQHCMRLFKCVCIKLWEEKVYFSFLLYSAVHKNAHKTTHNSIWCSILSQTKLTKPLNFFLPHMHPYACRYSSSLNSPRAKQIRSGCRINFTKTVKARESPVTWRIAGNAIEYALIQLMH